VGQQQAGPHQRGVQRRGGADLLGQLLQLDRILDAVDDRGREGGIGRVEVAVAGGVLVLLPRPLRLVKTAAVPGEDAGTWSGLLSAARAWDLESYLYGPRDQAKPVVLHHLNRLLSQFAEDYRSANKKEAP
jgi:hypothetical protein